MKATQSLCKTRTLTRGNKRYLAFRNLEHSSCSIFGFCFISKSWIPQANKSNLQDIVQTD